MSCENGSAADCLLRQLGELPVSPETLIIAGVGLAVVGVVMMWAGRPQAGRRRDRTGRPTGASGALTCAAVSAGVITGVEWAVVSQTGPGVGVGDRAGAAGVPRGGDGRAAPRSCPHCPRSTSPGTKRPPRGGGDAGDLTDPSGEQPR